MQLRSPSEPVKNRWLGHGLSYSQNGLKGIRSVETPKNDRLVGG